MRKVRERTRNLMRLTLALLACAAVAGGAAHAEKKSLRPVGDAVQQGEAIDRKYPEFQGKIISRITVRVREIFDDPDLEWLYRAANQLKITTKQEVVQRELLLKEGEPYSDFLRSESLRRLRGLRILREVAIVPRPDGDRVVLDVSVQETWTLIPQLNYSAGTASDTNYSAGVSESDLLGYGKRAELLYSVDQGRPGVEAVYDDPRVYGSDTRLLGAGFKRIDGNREVVFLGQPFRSFVQEDAWDVNADLSNTIGRLFENGDERYIYRQKLRNVETRYSVANGDPQYSLYRYTLGLRYQEDTFHQADAQDYEDLDLDPAEVSNDPSQLADNRRFIGPEFAIQKLSPRYISMAYIDRFERVEDFNLGNEYAMNFFMAPQLLGSEHDALLFSANHNRGYRIGDYSFFRGEVGAATRYERSDLENTLLRGEAHYYNVLGSYYLGDLFLGKHTLAGAFAIDYGIDLDRDREFVLGADTGLRGYEANAFSGRRRYTLNLEDRIHITEDVFRLVSVGAAVFFDAGASSNETLVDLIGSRTYSDVGAGLRFAFPRSSGGRVWRIDIAFPLRDGPDGSEAMEPRFLFSGGQLFGATLRSETVGPEKASVEVGVDR